MSTFVQLANEMRSLSGVQGTGPADVTTAVNIELKIVNYIINAWIDIQSNAKRWKWMQLDYLPVGGNPLQSIATTSDYVLSGVHETRTGTFRSYLTATGTSGRQPMIWVPWNRYRATYDMTTQTSDDRPLVVTRRPNGDLRFYPTPDAVYSLEFEYMKTAQVLAVNTDVPEMPSEFHQLIVYEALKRYGTAEDAPELVQLGDSAGGHDGSMGRPATGLWLSLIRNQELKDYSDNEEDEFLEVRSE